jgi:hypothetical protein
MKSDDKLSEVFDVQPIGRNELIIDAQPIVEKNERLEQDYETTRSNLHSILTQGQDALFHALEVAKNSEHPRAFEVVGGLMKNLSDINTQLLDLHRKKQQIESPREEAKSSNVTNNAIFVGSTNELSKMLETIRKEK